VLQDIRRARVDQIVVGGDVVPGPMPRETLRRLLELDLPVRFIHGNGDREVLAQMRGEEPTGVPEPFRDVVRWVAQELGHDCQPLLAGWPPRLRVEVDGLGEVLFCHATPRNDTEVFTRWTPEDRLLPVFANVDVPVVVCGHTHMPFDRMVGRVRVVNAGSVGMPYGQPGADWLLLGPDVAPQHTSYDLDGAAERIRATSYPQADAFATHNVLQPPTTEEALAAFTQMELKPA
jgi:predicted phosphodiesterase